MAEKLGLICSDYMHPFMPRESHSHLNLVLTYTYLNTLIPCLMFFIVVTFRVVFLSHRTMDFKGFKTTRT